MYAIEDEGYSQERILWRRRGHLEDWHSSSDDVQNMVKVKRRTSRRLYGAFLFLAIAHTTCGFNGGQRDYFLPEISTRHALLGDNPFKPWTGTRSSPLLSLKSSHSPLRASLSSREFPSSSSTVSVDTQEMKASTHGDVSSWKAVNSMKHKVMNCLGNGDYRGAMKIIEEMVMIAERMFLCQSEDSFAVGALVDGVIQAFAGLAFTPPYQGSVATTRRIKLGMRAIKLQLSSAMAGPYNRVPKRTLLNALKALTGLCECQKCQHQIDTTDDSFRILQRLITGAGIRHSSKVYSNGQIQEKDFNMVLNACSNVGRMDVAHRVVALQERTVNAPPLSPVAYSILLKGYGRRGDLPNVKMTLMHAKVNEIAPDTIMLNSLIDAYVNCNAIESSWEIFQYMKIASSQQKHNSSVLEEQSHSLFTNAENFPRPNRRTYNTVLKGLAKIGHIEQSLSLAQDMAKEGLWDEVTTNTLVHAAIVANNLTLAEEMLHRYTVTFDDSKAHRKRHPNVEAYTELLDAYAKAGQLTKAVQFLKLMKERVVQPNEVTYTCLVAAFARNKKVPQAWKTIRFMESSGLNPTYVTYNAFISALISPSSDVALELQPAFVDFDSKVDQALDVFRTMLQAGVRPNAVTVSILVDALGKCQPPRVDEAKALLQKKGIVFQGDEKVVTALVRTCGFGGDLAGALDAFQTLKQPDIVAVNSFLDACCRCKREKMAMTCFHHYFEKPKTNGDSPRLEPDVISYSILISALLRKNTVESTSTARRLYQEMKTAKKIQPDNALVDIILKAIIRTGRLHEKQVHLVASVLRDAEQLTWAEGQLESRKRAVRSVMAGRVRGDVDLRALLPVTVECEDKLFKRKGWNKVDSGFRLWGGGRLELNRQLEGSTKMSQESNEIVDEFLQSKGWNDIDSGFRII